MDFESVGGGAGAGGIIATIIALLGINRKQDKAFCIPTHKGIDDKFATIMDGQREIRDRLDDLNDYMRNRRKGYD